MLLLVSKSGGGCEFSCTYCEFTFSNERDLNNHLKTQHNVVPKDEIKKEDIRDEIKEEIIEDEPLCVDRLNIII
jgi:wyosine [tRNA(Phe)-imidazoG37] synthetase (radical SAM superfamily)